MIDPTPTTPHARRMFILARLQEGKSLTRNQLASSCECSKRTIQRDIKHLVADGWPIREGGPDGYTMETAGIQQIKSSEDIVIASLILAGGAIDQRFSIIAPDAAAILKGKLITAKDIDLQGWADDQHVAIPEQSPINDRDLRHFGILARRILNHQPVRFDYTPIMQDKGMSRNVYPIQLKEKDDSWYLLAYDYHFHAKRVFHLSRISKIRMPDTHFKQPSKKTIQEILQHGLFSIWDHNHGPQQTIRVRLWEYAARLIQEQTIHPSQKIDLISKDEVILHLQTNDLLGVRLWLRKYTPLVEILEPRELREEFLNDLQTAQNNHR